MHGLTYRDPIDDTVVGKCVVLVQHRAAALSGGARDRGQLCVVLEAVDVCGQNVEVWKNLVDEGLPCRGDLFGSI